MGNNWDWLSRNTGYILTLSSKPIRDIGRRCLGKNLWANETSVSSYPKINSSAVTLTKGSSPMARSMIDKVILTKRGRLLL
jgi:hypothetical protein